MVKRKWSVRTKNAAVAVLFLCAYSTSAVIPFVPVATTSALDTGWSTPTATHAPNNWDVNTVANAQTSNNVYISESNNQNQAGEEQGYSFNIPALPANAVINGVQVTAEAKSTDNNGCRLGVALSWNGGSNYSSYQYSNLGNSDSTENFGGTNDTWGHTWSASEFSAANFVMKLQDDDPGNSCSNSATTSVDIVSVKVHYTVPVQPVANPALSQACGLDIAIVIDNSTSIDSNEMTLMKTALTSFTSALAGTPTEFSVTRFATSASVLQGFTNNVTDVNSAINGVPVGGGFTNWEDGFVKAQSTLPNRSNPDLVLFATDGDPTTSNTVGGTDTGQPNAHLDPAIVAANSVKAGGARVLALGIGLGGNTGSVDRLKQISGPNADTGSVLTSDVITTNFSTLAQDLATFAEQTCGGTITTQKLIDADGNPQTTNDQTPAQNWQFDINGGSNPAPALTDAQGLTPAVKVDAGSGYSVNETTQAGYAVIAASCTGASNNGTWNGSSVTGMTVAANNVVRCTFVNKVQTGHVKLIKNVINDNGGTLGANDFGLTVGGVSVSSEQTVSVPAGTPVAINEAGANGYSFVSITGAGCPAALGGTVTPADGQTITCTITNDDKPGKLIVKKVVVNDNGGQKTASDFKFQVNGGTQTAFETDGENELTVNAGTYSVTEVADSQYTTNYDTCTNLSIPLGGTQTCTITNNDKPATLKLTKTVINDNGGLLVASDFPVFLNGQTSSWGIHAVDAGNYTVAETTQPGYAPSAWGGDCVTTQNGTSVTLLPGETKECTITNDDQPAQLSGVKYEVNSDGSTVQVLSGWTICLDANNNDVCDPGEATTVTGADGSYSFTGLNVGTYNLAETNNLGGTVDGWTQIFTPQAVVLGLGDNSTDNDFGNFKNVTAGGYKWEDHNGNGQRDQNDQGLSGWTIFIDENDNQTLDNGEVLTTTSTDGSYTFSNLGPGTYVVCEVQQNGWTQTYPGGTGCHELKVTDSGQAQDDVNFGNFKNADIKGYKFNDHNGNGQEDNGDEHLTGWTIQLKNAQGAVIATAVTDGNGYSFTDLAPGDYTVCEVQKANWVQTTPGGNGCKDLAVQSDGNYTVLFGNQAQGSLTVVKNVDDGFNTVSIDVAGWTWNYDGSYAAANNQAAGSGNAVTVPADSYELSENQQTNYHFTSVSCTKNNQAIMVEQSESFNVSVGAGDAVVCTFTNTRDTAHITVTKTVVNDNGGTAQASDFNLFVNKDVVTSGDTNTFVTDQDYQVSEAPKVSGYEMTSLTCWLADDVLKLPLQLPFTLQYGHDVDCEIVNDDIAPQLTVYKYVDNGLTNNAKTAADFTMTVDGAHVSSASFPGDEAGTTVTLDAGDYTASEDNHDGYAMYAYGDCSGTIAVGEHAYCEIDNIAIEDPRINVEKSGPVYAYVGNNVTYTFTVTNTGNVALPGITVDDDVAGVGTYVSGDTSDDGMLDPDETWIYTANYTIPTGVTSIHNTVTACFDVDEYYQLGDDTIYDRTKLGRIVPEEFENCDQDDHTTQVFTPQVLGATTTLENTGNTLTLPLMLSSGLLGLALLTMLQGRHRRNFSSRIDPPFVIPTE
ncbi:VWA domain-containing protein [Candidatus Saccharibacteria bacterium]|nr:VWA domain-containing protein [Candidatus Saccharibacteria bacterium]